MSSYKLKFKTKAKKEWDKLNGALKTQFLNVLKKRLEQPHVTSAKLSGMDNCYKIKLKQAGYRLVYEVRDSELVVSVVAVGKRNRNQVYNEARKRIE